MSLNLSLSALGGGEGRGEVGDPAAPPTFTLPPLRDGSLPLPPQAGGEGKAWRLVRQAALDGAADGQDTT